MAKDGGLTSNESWQLKGGVKMSTFAHEKHDVDKILDNSIDGDNKDDT